MTDTHGPDVAGKLKEAKMKRTVYINDELAEWAAEEMPDLNYSALFAQALNDEYTRRQEEARRRRQERVREIKWAESVYGAEIKLPQGATL